jgi:hypothetical protein
MLTLWPDLRLEIRMTYTILEDSKCFDALHASWFLLA